MRVMQGIMRVMQDDVEYEFVEYKVVLAGDYYLTSGGLIIAGTGHEGSTVRAIFCKVPKTYDRFGIRWEETGEVRMAEAGEVYLSDVRGPVLANNDVLGPLPILRPIAILDEESNARWC